VPRKVARRDEASLIVAQEATNWSPLHEVHTAAAVTSSSRGEVGRRLLALRVLALGAVVVLLGSGCGGSKSHASTAAASSTARSVAETTSAGSPTATSVAAVSTSANTSVSGNTCPQVMVTEKAAFYPIQGSFSAGYSLAAIKLNSTTQSWAYEVTGDFPYSQWMAWYVYNTSGVPLFKFSDAKLKADSGSTNPFVDGNPVLAPQRHYHIYFMPATTPQSVISSMQQQGENVALLPKVGSTEGVSIVSRSYWSYSNDGLGNYDRFGYRGPTHTPYPVIQAFLTNASTGQVTANPAGDCGSQSQLPKRLWFNPQTYKPFITFVHAPRPTTADLKHLPKYLLQSGAVSGTIGAEFPPSPVPSEVQFYRNNASKAPYADVESAPPAGNPPDACGGYVMANLPNDAVSLVHVPQVPSFPDYRGATASTLNQSNNFNVEFYSFVIYGATKQIDAVGSVNNSQIGNGQIHISPDGSATLVLWPQSATQAQIQQIAAAAKANGWNLLRSGLQTTAAPNMLVIREKGQNDNWKGAISANSVTQGAPCPQSTNPFLPLPQDPSSAQATQDTNMGLTAPDGQNCTIGHFLSGRCLSDLEARLKKAGWAWSAKDDWPVQKAP